MGSIIKGIGTDIVDITRIESLSGQQQASLAAKILTPSEREALTTPISPQTIAARFAAKEAVAKAMGTGFVSFSLADITISHSSLGQPYVVCSENLAGICAQIGISSFMLSVSHEKKTAIAFCVALGESD